MQYRDYQALAVKVEAGIARVTISNPPINLFDLRMIGDLVRFVAEVRDDADVRAIVFDSADPDFFVGHADMALFLDERDHMPPKPTDLNPLQQLFEDLRQLPQATIVVLEGKAIGGGTEFVTACDMTFAARGKGILSLFEVAIGGIPGATGTQRLPRLLGRSRALEAILGCEEFDADLAERYGYINRAFDAAELRPFVDRLAKRIASFPGRAIKLAKEAVEMAELPIREGLLEEMHVVNQVLMGGEHQRMMRALLALGAQTEKFERAGFTAQLEDLQPTQQT